MKNDNRLTEGGTLQVLLRFAAPFLAANILQALYGAVDLAVVGWFCSPESVAAVSTGAQVTQIITSVISGLTLGSTILVGRYIGENRPDLAKTAIGTTLTVFALFSLVLTGAMLAGLRPMLTALQTPAAAFERAADYVSVCSWGIFFICGYNAISAVLRGYGDSRRPMYYVALACVLNIAGDLVFVGLLGMDVAGAALATVLAQAIAMICAVVQLNRSRFLFTFRLSAFRIQPSMALRLAGIGIPITLQECMVRLSFLYLTSVTNRLGVDAAAAVGVASKYDVFAMLPATSIASALAAITAQNFGAGKQRRAAVSLWAGLGFALAASACFFAWAQLSPETMIGIFARDRAIIAAGIPFFRACSYDYLAVTFVFCLNGYLNGRGLTLFTMVSCCFGALCLRMPLIAYVFSTTPEDLGRLGTIAPVVSGIMAVYTLGFTLWRMARDARPKTKA